MHLLEVVRADATAPEVLATALALDRVTARMGEFGAEGHGDPPLGHPAALLELGSVAVG